MVKTERSLFVVAVCTVGDFKIVDYQDSMKRLFDVDCKNFVLCNP